jgi:hypothetical protein
VSITDMIELAPAAGWVDCLDDAVAALKLCSP